jgi:ribonuclease HI
VIDDEAHAVCEALSYLLRLPAAPLEIIVCIDNSAIVSLLERNSSHSEFVHIAQTHAADLVARGTTVRTRWIPAHIGIQGNEQADELTKNGSEKTDSLCPGSRTTVTHLRRVNRKNLYTTWALLQTA